jgi:protein-arginine kinase activator protein McsA
MSIIIECPSENLNEFDIEYLRNFIKSTMIHNHIQYQKLQNSSEMEIVSSNVIEKIRCYLSLSNQRESNVNCIQCFYFNYLRIIFDRSIRNI